MQKWGVHGFSALKDSVPFLEARQGFRGVAAVGTTACHQRTTQDLRVDREVSVHHPGPPDLGPNPPLSSFFFFFFVFLGPYPQHTEVSRLGVKWDTATATPRSKPSLQPTPQLTPTLDP